MARAPEQQARDSDASSRAVHQLLDGLDDVVVSPEVQRVLSEHVRDRETGVFGRRDHGLGSSLGLKDAVVSRGSCALGVPLVDLMRGSMCVLVGPNGSGKSTFFDALMDDDSVTLDLREGSGTLVVGTSNNLHRKRQGRTRLARLDQEEILGPIAGLSALDTLRQGLRFFLDQFPVDDARWAEPDGYDDNLASQEAQLRITEITSALFNLFRMDECARVRVRQLSGGERTKLSLMLVMMSDADVALFDEPTNHLDLVTIAKLLGIFDKLQRAGVTVVNVSHVGWFLKLAGTHRTLQIDGAVLQSYRSPFARVGRHLQLSPTRVEGIVWCADGRPSSGVLLEGLRDCSIPDSPLQQVHFGSLVPGEVRLLIGDNGSGKTTLLEYYARHVEVRLGNVAYLPQFWPEDFVASRPTTERFFDQVVEQTLASCDAHALSVARNRFLQKLQGTSLDGRHRRFFDLSGGEQRLTWFVAVSSIPAVDVIMADEPTNHMDDGMRQLITRALVDFANRGGGVLLSSHDLDLMQALEANTAVSLRLDTFTKQDGRTVIQTFEGKSISAHVSERIAAARIQGGRAIESKRAR
ncbi:MAG: ATP-binding cassette domain-containing protein [Pseudomonadota bacterium]